MIMRKLRAIPKMPGASSESLNEYGIPKSLDDLAGFRVIDSISSRTKPTPMPLAVLYPLNRQLSPRAGLR